ncbi:MAG: hypothetical protein ACOYD4_04075 [Solirubrobacterales bacterium]
MTMNASLSISAAMAKNKSEARKTIRTDAFGVKRCAITVFLPIACEDRARAMIKKRKAPNGLICQSLKAVCEAILEDNLKA